MSPTSPASDPDLEELAAASEHLSDSDISTIVTKLSATIKLAEDDEKISAPKESTDIRTLLSTMTIAQKIKVAMFGDAIARGLLIRDPNRMIQQFVLKNPQLSLEEIIEFAKNPNTPKGVLRTLSETNKLIKEYQIKQALCFNPKTPLDITMKWVKFLTVADLKKLGKSKSVPQTLVTVVRKRTMDLEKKK